MRAWAWLLSGAVLISAACSSGGDDSDPGAISGGGSVFGDDRPSSDPDVAERIATRAVDAVVSECGGGCAADVDAGYARLGEGKMLAAFDAFKCADSPEAAFGAGISRVLGVLESANGDALMADLGLAHLPASDVFGAEGWLARLASRWNGQAQLTITGGLALQLDSDQVTADDYELEIATHQGAERVRFTIETDTILTPGATVALQYNCATGSRTGSAPSVWLNVDDGQRELDCNVPFSAPAQECMAGGGSLRVVASGDQPGDHVEYELTDLLLECEPSVEAEEGISEQPSPMPSVFVRVSGMAKADVVLSVDTSDLHAIFRKDNEDLLLRSVPAGVTSTRFMNHAAAIAGEVASARCYFAKAAEGSGTVFTLPGSLYAGHDIALGPGDARMLASASGFAAATVELGTSYELELSMQQVACALEGGFDEAPMCGSKRDYVSMINAKARSATVRRDRLSAARALLALALDDFETGVEQLDANSALVRDDASMPGWDLALELVLAAQASLSGRTAVPHLSPAAHIDLGGFFASPPDPAKISRPPLLYSEDCEDLGDGTRECYDDTGLDPEYANAFFASHSDLDWNGEYEWDGSDDDAENALEHISQQLRDKGLTWEQ